MSPTADLMLTDLDVYCNDRSGHGVVRSRSGKGGSWPLAPATATWLEFREGPNTEVISMPGLHGVARFSGRPHPCPVRRPKPVARLAQRRLGREEYLRVIAEYAAANPDEPWIVGGGWAMEAFPGGLPRKEDLDAIVPDRPVFLFNKDVHGAWVNSVALERAGITQGHPRPVRRTDRARSRHR